MNKKDEYDSFMNGRMALPVRILDPRYANNVDSDGYVLGSFASVKRTAASTPSAPKSLSSRQSKHFRMLDLLKYNEESFDVAED